MATKHALVQFSENKKRGVKLLVLTKDVKGFNPSTPADIPDRTFLVKWQDSFHDDGAGIHHDGCYPAKILMVGATPEEIRAKCKEMKISLPLTFPVSENCSEKAMEKPLKKTRRTRDYVNHEDSSKRKRMSHTSKLIDASKPAEVDSSKSRKDSHSNDRSRHKSSRKSPKIDRTKSCADVMDSEDNSRRKSSDKSSKINRTKSCANWNDSEDFSKNSSDKSLGSSLKPDEKLGSSPSHDSDVETEKDSSDAEPGSPQLQHLGSQFDMFSRKCDDQPAFKETPPIKVNEPRRIKKSAKIVSSDDSCDEDDPTVLLDQLKAEHSICLSKIKRMEGEIAYHLQNEAKLLQDIAQISSENFTLKIKLNKLAAGNDRGASPNSESASSLAPLENCSNFGKTSPLSFPKSSDMKEASSPIFPSSPSGTPKHLHSKDVNSVSKILFKDDRNQEQTSPSKKDAATDDFGEGLEAVAKRIEADLRGKKPLSGDDKKVNVGMGFKIGRKAWEKSLRLKNDDSKFLKDCAGMIWGREALQQRTGNRSTANKKPCTPKKVALLHAMLKGKMRARDEDEKQQLFILTNMAPKWLTDKCYDSGRQPKAKKT